MKKFFLSISLLLAGTGFVFSQELYQLREAMDLFRSNQLQTGEWKLTLSESEIEGSPYLNHDFIPGTVYTTSKTKFVEIPLRDNIYNDQLEFKNQDDQVLALAAPEIVEKVEFGDYTMLFMPYSNVKKIFRGFFILIEEGTASLYERPEIQYQEPTEPGAYKEAEPAKFLNKPSSYYIRVGLEQAKKADKRNELADIFPDHKNEIEAFVKKQKPRTNKPEDLTELVRYYNSLK